MKYPMIFAAEHEILHCPGMYEREAMWYYELWMIMAKWLVGREKFISIRIIFNDVHIYVQNNSEVIFIINKFKFNPNLHFYSQTIPIIYLFYQLYIYIDIYHG